MQWPCHGSSKSQLVDFIRLHKAKSPSVGECRHACGQFATRVLAIVLALFTLGGCEREQTQSPVQPVGDLHHNMTWVLDPAADVIWGSAGFVLTAEGEQSLAPTNDEEWARVRHSAAVLAEGGNLLVLPHLMPAPDGETPDSAAWVEFAHGMTRIAQQAIDAVDARDPERLFEVGGHLYNVCLACHQIYARDAGGTEPTEESGA